MPIKLNKVNAFTLVFIISLMLCFCSVPTNVNQSSRVLTSSKTLGKDIDVSVVESVLLQMVNNHRKNIQLPLLKLHPAITLQALEHSKKMASMSIAFSHDGFSKRFELLKSQLSNVQKGAENIAAGNASMQVIMTDWLNSKGHRKNIEGDFNLTGIAASKTKNGVVYYTQIFIKND